MRRESAWSALSPRRFAALGIVLFIAVALYYLVFSQLYYHPQDRERADISNNWLQSGFSVAIVWPPHTDKSLIEGVTLALEDVNAAKGPLAGKIRLRIYSEISDKGAVARDVAANHDVLAVIGHELVGTSIPASITYEEHGIVFFSPKITDQRLTHHQFDYVFRLTPSDSVMAEAIADFAIQRQWKRVGILYGRILRHQLVADEFVAFARHNGIEVPFTHSFFHEPDYRTQDFRRMISDIRKEQFDAIMLADDLPWAGKVLMDIQRMGITQPIIGTDKIDSAQVWQVASTAANGLYVASAVNPDSPHPTFVSFRERFRKRFGADPGYGASQGYEAFMVYVNAILKAGSADPIVVATTLKTNAWQGLFGEFTFDVDGDIIGRDVSIKQMQNGSFKFVASESAEKETIK